MSTDNNRFDILEMFIKWTIEDDDSEAQFHVFEAGALAERARQSSRYREALDMLRAQAQTIKGYMDVVDEMLGRDG